MTESAEHRRSPEEELLAHAGFLQGLVRGLAGDPSRADDLVQQTWLAALERPPRRPGALPAWLARVARNFAFRSRREGERRRRRERGAARPEAVPSAAATAAARQEVALLQAALEELEEPAREVLFRRYYQGLPPQEIARVTGLPVNTVKSRLQRALERLRARLDRHHGGDRRAWLGALAPVLAGPPQAFGPGSVPALLGGGALLVVMKLKMVGLVCLLLALGALGWRLAVVSAGAGIPEEGKQKPVPAARQEGGGGPGAHLLPGAGPIRRRAPAAAPGGTVPAVTGRVASWEGPVAGARVYLHRIPDPEVAPDMALVREPLATGRSGADGSFRLELPPRLLPGRFDLGVVALGYRRRLVADLDVPAGGCRQDFVLERGLALTGRVLDGEGRPVPGLAILACRGVETRKYRLFLKRHRRLRSLATRYSTYHEGRGVTDDQGFFRITGLAEGAYGLEADSLRWLVHPPLQARTGQENLEVRVAPSWSISCLVRDGKTGKPIPSFYCKCTISGRRGFGLSGSEGLFQVNFLAEEKDTRDKPFELSFHPPGYLSSEVKWQPDDQGQVRDSVVEVWRLEDLERNRILFDIRFAGGTIPDVEFKGWFNREDGGGGSASFDLVPLGQGRHRGLLPPGKLELKIYPKGGFYFSPWSRWTGGVEGTGGRRMPIQVEMPEWGKVLLYAPPSGSGCECHAFCETECRFGGRDGGATNVPVSRDPWKDHYTLRFVPPARWKIALRGDGRHYRYPPVEVKAGGVHPLRPLPE